MERRVRSAYVDIVERRALEGNLYRVTIAANERVRQPPELEAVQGEPRLLPRRVAARALLRPLLRVPRPVLPPLQRAPLRLARQRFQELLCRQP